MGAAPVLIMLAAIGVDYGWQPDGTTSTRGDNIEYIVQISPDQLQQLQSIGEITSSIDPTVQGRVSRIVVRVGTGKLPQDAGTVIGPATNGRTVSSGVGDQQAIPIPEIARPGVQAYAAADVNGKNANASVMKPDPQGGGFSMPNIPQAGAPQFGAQDSLDQVRSRAAQNANAAPANSSPFDFNRGPSTDEVPAAARSTSGWSGSSSFVGPPAPKDPQSLTNPLGSNPPNPFGTGAGRNGLGTSQTFGALPTAANSATNGFTPPYAPAATQPSTGFADSRTTQQPPPVPDANGYIWDKFGNIFNSENKLVDANGYEIDPRYAKFQGANGQTADGFNNIYDSSGNQIDKYGNIIDKFGKAVSTPGVMSSTQPTTPYDPRPASTASATYPNAPSNYTPPTIPSQLPTTAQLLAQREAERYAQQQQADLENYNRTRTGSAAPVAARDVDPRSPSDIDLVSATRLAIEQERTSLANAAKMKSFSAQPLFNMVLLISLVGNAYLIFETNNLRRKFRSMLSTFRSAKAAAQPVA